MNAQLAASDRLSADTAMGPVTLLVGDLDDPKSEIRQLLARRKNKTLIPEAGTKPRVFYLT